MQTMKKYTKRILSSALALLMVMTCFVLPYAPKASAEVDKYYWKVIIKDVSGTNWLGVKKCMEHDANKIYINYKPNNGNGAAVTNDDNSCISLSKNELNEKGKTWEKTGSSNGFPYEFDGTRIKNKNSSNDSKYQITLLVSSSSSGPYTQVAYQEMSINHGAYMGKITVPTSEYPYVNNTGSISGADEVKVNRDGSQVTSGFTVSATDQFGVGWKSCTWSSNNTLATVAPNGLSCTGTFRNSSDNKDYTATLTASFTDANSSHNSTPATKSVTVRVPHSVSVSANGGTYSGTTPVTGKYTGETVTLGSVTRTAYDFANWSKSNGEGSVSSNIYTFGTGNGAVQANWTPHTYTMNFDGNGGTVAPTSTTYDVEDTTLNLPTSAVRTGYNFVNWTIAPIDGSVQTNWTEGDVVTSSISGKYGDVTARANWSPIGYTLSFDTNKGNRPGTVSISQTSKPVTYDAVYGELPTPTLPGYTFAGWFTEATGGTQVTSNTIYQIASNSTVYARWTTNSYTVTYNVDGGVALNPSSFSIEGGNLSSTTKVGYTFNKWQVIVANGNWVMDSLHNEGESLAGKYGNVTVKALWNANPYTITFNKNDSDRVGTATCDLTSKGATYDSAIGELPTPSLTGYEFNGWYTEATGGARIDATTIYNVANHLPAGDVTLYAHWTPITYTASFLPEGGEIVESINYTIESTFTFPTDSRIGYTFEVWGDGTAGNWVAGETFEANATSPAHRYGDVTFKASWIPNTYTLTFDKNGDTAVDGEFTQKTVTYDAAIGEMPTPTRIGYDFGGWFTENEHYTTEVTADTIYTIANGSTVYAKWNPITYTVTYNMTQGEAIEPTTYDITKNLKLEPGVCEGYTFVKWIVTVVDSPCSFRRFDNILSTDLNKGTGHYGNITVTPVFEVNQYTITWKFNDGNGMPQQSTSEKDYGYSVSDIDAPIVPQSYSDATYTYTFSGWSPAFAPVAGDTTYEAQYTRETRKYTVTWVNEANETVHTQDVAVGDSFNVYFSDTSLDAVEKYGYTVKWGRAGISYNNGDTIVMPTSNITITPIYTPIKYTITWQVEGKAPVTTQVDFGTIPTEPAGLDKTKAADEMYTYTFKEWSPAITAVDGDKTYNAVFEGTPIKYTITFKDDLNNVLASYELGYGVEITNIPAIPERENSVGSWIDLPQTMPAHDLVVYCEYSQNARYIYWIVEGESYRNSAEDGTQPEYDRVTPTKAATAEYTFEFAGWAETEGGTVLATMPTVDGEELTFYAVFNAIPKMYTVTWYADGAVVDTQQVAFGAQLPDVEIPAKTGHTATWAGAPATMPARNINVVASYTPINYTITWVVNGNSIETTFAYGTTPVFHGTTSKPASETTVYTFAGWDKAIVTVTGDETYTAQYTETAREYTLTWRASGVVVESLTVAYGSPITAIAVPTKTGYDGVWSEVPETMPARDLTITANYSPKSYTITWVTPDGEIQEQWHYDSTPVFSGTPVKAETAEMEYTFSGWSPAVTTVTGPARYVAVFTETPKSYTITFIADGVVVSSSELRYGDTINRPEVPEKEGHSASWNLIYSSMPARDLEVEAIYTARQYLVYWRVDNRNVYQEYVTFGTPIPVKPVPSKTGNTGVWDDQFNTMPARNIVINAFYTPNTYTLSWRFDDGEGSTEVTFGVDYEYTFVSENLPDGLRIVINGRVIAENSFTYNAETGAFVFPGRLITGDITITAKAAAGYQNAAVSVTNGSATNQPNIVVEGMTFHTQFTPPAGYLPPYRVTVMIDGVALTSGYTYDAETGRLTVNGEVIYGELSIVAVCPVDPDYVPPVEEPEDPEEPVEPDDGIWGFFRRLINFFRRLFGMEEI